MDKLNSNFLSIIINDFTIGALCGMLLAPFLVLLYERDFFTFSKNLTFESDPVGLLSIAVTIFLAYHISNRLNKKNDIKKEEKKFLITNLDGSLERFSRWLYEALKEKRIPLESINGKIKTHRGDLSKTLDLARECFEFESDTDEIKTIKLKMTSIWKLFTGDSKTSEGDIDVINIKDTTYIVLSEARKLKIEQSLNDLRGLILRFSLNLNRE